MRAVTWTVRVLRYDQLTFWRTPPAVFFTFAMPVLMLAVFGSLNRGDTIEDLTGVPYTRYLILGLAAFAVSVTAYGNLAARVTFRRETGIYQRLRTTPLPAGALIGGQVASAVLAVAGVVSILLLVGGAFFDGAAPANWSLFLAVLVVGASACCAVGVAVSTFVPNVESVDAIVFATMLPVSFISGSFQYVPSDSLLGQIAEVFPVRHILLGTLDAYDLPGAKGSIWVHLAVIAAWGIGGALVAVRRFRWAPHRS